MLACLHHISPQQNLPSSHPRDSRTRNRLHFCPALPRLLPRELQTFSSDDKTKIQKQQDRSSEWNIIQPFQGWMWNPIKYLTLHTRYRVRSTLHSFSLSQKQPPSLTQHNIQKKQHVQKSQLSPLPRSMHRSHGTYFHRPSPFISQVLCKENGISVALSFLGRSDTRKMGIRLINTVLIEREKEEEEKKICLKMRGTFPPLQIL